MRYIFEMHGEHLPENPVRQVKRLNDLLINEIMPGIMTNIEQYYGYIFDINAPLQIPMMPLSDSVAGRKSILPSITTTFGV